MLLLTSYINLKLIRIFEFFLKFSFKVTYTPGKENLIIDVLSRFTNNK